MPTWTTIQTFTYPHEAGLAKARLEASGIACFLQDELTVNVASIYSNALGGVKLQVHEEDIEAAYKILVEGGFIIESGHPQKTKVQVLDPQQVQDHTKCPFCQSENIDTVVNPSALVVLFYFILGVIFPIFKSWEKCDDCNKEWKYKKKAK